MTQIHPFTPIDSVCVCGASAGVCKCARSTRRMPNRCRIEVASRLATNVYR